MNITKNILFVTIEFDTLKEAREFVAKNKENVMSDEIAFDMNTRKYWIVVNSKQAQKIGL